MDVVHGLDPAKLLLAATGLAFAISPFVAPPYNLPILLFGSYALDNEAVQPLQTFTLMLALSAFFDVIWMVNNGQHGFIKLLTRLLLLLKIPTFFACSASLHQRGGLLLSGAGVSSTTIWSMPGGFASTNRDGYETVGEETFVRNSRPATNPPQAPNTVPVAPGAYQSV